MHTNGAPLLFGALFKIFIKFVFFWLSCNLFKLHVPILLGMAAVVTGHCVEIQCGHFVLALLLICTFTHCNKLKRDVITSQPFWFGPIPPDKRAMCKDLGRQCEHGHTGPQTSPPCPPIETGVLGFRFW